MNYLTVLHVLLYGAFGATCGVVGISVTERPGAFFALFGIFMATDIISSIRTYDRIKDL